MILNLSVVLPDGFKSDGSEMVLSTNSSNSFTACVTISIVFGFGCCPFLNSVYNSDLSLWLHITRIMVGSGDVNRVAKIQNRSLPNFAVIFATRFTSIKLSIIKNEKKFYSSLP